MTNWEKWIEELKNSDIDKAKFICNCGLYNQLCKNIITGEKCPLDQLAFCTKRDIGNKFLDEEVEE